MKSVRIKTEFSADHITRAAGERLRRIILESTAGACTVEIDFTGVTVASSSFFDEGIAKLAEEGWTRGRLEKQVILKNLNPMDRKVLERAMRYRGWTVV